MLTQKQHKLLMFIHTRLQNSDIAPSFDEMKDALDLKSKSGIHRLITALVERGYLERLPNRARALQIVKLPKDMASTSLEGVDNDTPETSKQMFDTDMSGVRHIPLYGKVAAGTPIEAIRHDGDYFDAPLSILGSGDFYGLNVDGDSMKDIGINDGDLAVIRRTATANKGDVVVALVRGEEVTLKTFDRDGKIILLKPENDDYDVQRYPEGDVEIQGVLASLIRQY